MAQGSVYRFILLSSLLWAAPLAQADVFMSQDGAFTLDMPAGWSQVKNAPKDCVLCIEKNSSRIDIKKVDCSTEACIEQKTTDDLADVKSKKMQVIGNSYTGEEIKRIEFSTGDPFFYINFFTPKNDFGAGYFLIDKKGYSILAKDLTYAETDLIFSFISPVHKETPVKLEMDLQSSRAYDIAALPAVQEESLDLNAPMAQPTQAQAQPQTAQQTKRPFWGKLKKKLSKLKVNTLLSEHMPPYVRRLGHGFDVLAGLLALFVILQAGSGAVRLFWRNRKALPPANPNSLYPIKFKRLYGTPSVIFRAKDNQGNVLTSLSSRWDGVFLFAGMMLVVLSIVVLAGTGLGEKSGLLPFSSFTYSTIYSACSLLIPIGVMIFFCGVVWSQLVLREVTLFDRKGKKAAVVLQKGFGLAQERYEIYFARSKDVLIATRKRFAWRRSWQLFTQSGTPLASITEQSAWKAGLRKLCGHIWGLLRADYEIEGQMECKGYIQSAHTPFNRFVCNIDKPQALNARDLLAVSLLINIRDKDKWYPWFN